MSEPNDPWIDRKFEAQVRDTAYFLWENDGRPHGREQEYWFAALEKCLRQREADGLLQQGPAGPDGHADGSADDFGAMEDHKGNGMEQTAGTKGIP